MIGQKKRKQACKQLHSSNKNWSNARMGKSIEIKFSSTQKADVVCNYSHRNENKNYSILSCSLKKTSPNLIAALQNVGYHGNVHQPPTRDVLCCVVSLTLRMRWRIQVGALLSKHKHRTHDCYVCAAGKCAHIGEVCVCFLMVLKLIVGLLFFKMSKYITWIFSIWSQICLAVIIGHSSLHLYSFKSNTKISVSKPVTLHYIPGT